MYRSTRHRHHDDDYTTYFPTIPYRTLRNKPSVGFLRPLSNPTSLERKRKVDNKQRLVLQTNEGNLKIRHNRIKK